MMVPEVDDMKGGNMHSPPSAPPIPHANLYQQEPSVIGVPVPPPSPGPGGSANHNNNNNNDDDDEQVVEDGRQEFSNYTEFFLTSVGYCVGLGNLVGMSERGFLFFFFIVRSKPLRCSHSPPDRFASFPHTPTKPPKSTPAGCTTTAGAPSSWPTSSSSSFWASRSTCTTSMSDSSSEKEPTAPFRR